MASVNQDPSGDPSLIVRSGIPACHDIKIANDMP